MGSSLTGGEEEQGSGAAPQGCTVEAEFSGVTVLAKLTVQPRVLVSSWPLVYAVHSLAGVQVSSWSELHSFLLTTDGPDSPYFPSPQSAWHLVRPMAISSRSELSLAWRTSPEG